MLYFGVGTFGRIYHGILIGEDENDVEAEQDVFIKTVTGTHTSSIIDWIILTHLFYGVGASIPGRSSILGERATDEWWVLEV